MFRALAQQLSNHSALWPLVGSCVLASSFTAYILARTSQKQEVEWNRWKDNTDFRGLMTDAVKNPMTRFHILPKNQNLFKVDPIQVSMGQMIYGDGDYTYNKVKSEQH